MYSVGVASAIFERLSSAAVTLLSHATFILPLGLP